MLSSAKDWIILALEDYDVVGSLNIHRHRGAIVYHLQQFVEKLCKAVICLYSQEPPRTHRPSTIIDQIIAEAEVGQIRMGREERNILIAISSLAKTFEDEATRPRYGVRHHDRIIPPNKYYSVDQINEFLNDARYLAGLVADLIEIKGVDDELREVCARLREIRSELSGQES